MNAIRNIINNWEENREDQYDLPPFPKRSSLQYQAELATAVLFELLGEIDTLKHLCGGDGTDNEQALYDRVSIATDAAACAIKAAALVDAELDGRDPPKIISRRQ